MIFSKLYKKRGFHETLFALYSAQNYSLTLPEFFEKLEEQGSYYNAFFRIKSEMLRYNILLNKKNRNKEKVLALTQKGVDIVKILKSIDDLLDLTWDEYQEKIKRMKKLKASRERRRVKKQEK